MRQKLLTLLSMLLWCSLTAAPQTAVTDSSMRISLLTCAPGPDIYELEGHSGLRIASKDFDVVANWGLFDFASPGFVYRFVKGETDYCVGLIPTELFLESYRRQGREVASQTFNLTHAEAVRVKDLVDDNLLPWNRVYRYNYVLDNCATRPLAIISKAIGDSIALGNPPEELADARTTFRRAMRHYHAGYPWYQFGIDLALGSGIDQTISRRELIFAPVALSVIADSAMIVERDGTRRPLISDRQTLVEGKAGGARSEATPFLLSPLFVFSLLFLAVAALSYRNIKRQHLSRWLDFTLYCLYGVAGCIIAFLIFVSVHEATSPNYLFLWLNPLCLIVAGLSIFRHPTRLLLWLQGLRLAAMSVLIAVWLVGIQTYNIAFIPLIAADALRAATQIILIARRK